MNALLDPSDRALLDEVRCATENPWRDPVRVGGTLIPRKLARHIERVLARLDLMDRRSHRAAGSGASSHSFHFAGDSRG